MKKFLVFLFICALAFYGYKHYIQQAPLDSDSELSGKKTDSATDSTTPPAGAITPATGTATTMAAATPVPTATPNMVKCYRCQGTGTIKCPAGCDNGWVPCPGPCLKLSVGTWVHHDMPGHDPNLLWRAFPYPGGRYWWSQQHVGQVVEMVNGMPQITGVCKICGGKGKVPCTTCNGAGTIVCPICHGQKMLVVMNATPPPMATPVVTMPPGAHVTSAETESKGGIIKLKGGKTISGKIVIMDADNAIIRTNDGSTVEVRASNVLIDPH